nr:hypothetical protein [Tanacetum cinerariifolium]
MLMISFLPQERCINSSQSQGCLFGRELKILAVGPRDRSTPVNERATTINGGGPPVNHRKLPPDHRSTTVGPLLNHQSMVVDHRSMAGTCRVNGRSSCHVAPPEWATWQARIIPHQLQRRESNPGPLAGRLKGYPKSQLS